MQVLSFVNADGPESWKNGNAKRFVRSHAMKDFRRKQREEKKQKLGTAVVRSQPGKSADVVASATPTTASSLPKRGIARKYNSPTEEAACDKPALSGSIEKYRHDRQSSLPTTLSPSLQDFLNRAAVTPPPCSVLPKIFPTDHLLIASLPSPVPSNGYEGLNYVSTGSPRALSPALDFDLSVCKTIHAALDAAGANFYSFTKHYFNSVHAYLTFIHRKRFFERVAGLSKKATAETALLLLCMQICAEPTRSNAAASVGTLYITAKALFQSVCARKRPSIELIQAGALLTLFEHNTDLQGVDYQTLQECHRLALALGLDALPKSQRAVSVEEKLRLNWGLLSLDCILSLHDEKQERSLLFPTPSPDDDLPSISDSEYENADDELSAATTNFLVHSRLPTWADGFSRQAQVMRLLYMVLSIVRERFETSPDLMISRIEHLDNLVNTSLSNLLADCNGEATQYCGAISCCLTASYLLHEYQLLSTIHTPSPKASDTQAPTRSKLAIETMIEMMVNILREFPVSHTPELSPMALWSTYKAAMLDLLLKRISGSSSQPTLSGTSFDQMVTGLRHFSTVWPCTASYIKVIALAQSRSLPMPALVTGSEKCHTNLQQA